MPKKLLSCLFLLWSLFTNAYGAPPDPDANGVFYVNKNVSASSNQSGNSWTNAMSEMADALKFAKTLNKITPGKVKQIWVAAGTYKPLYSAEDSANFGDGNRDNSFVLVSDVQIYGGFVGTETALTERNLKNNVSTLSGDLGVVNIATDNAYHVVVAVNVSENTILDGFVITGGNANSVGSIKLNHF